MNNYYDVEIDYKRTGFLYVLDYFKGKPINLVEIGISRRYDISDGNSVNVWMKYLTENGGSYTGVDLAKESIAYTEQVVRGYNIDKMENVRLYNMDAIEFLSNYDGEKIDLLYLDGYDFNRPKCHESAVFHVACAYEALPFMAEDSLIIIDDIFDNNTYNGKGEIAIPYLIGMGWNVQHEGYQFVLGNK